MRTLEVKLEDIKHLDIDIKNFGIVFSIGFCQNHFVFHNCDG